MTAKEGDARVLGSEVYDATMMDVGERDRPPGDPPDGRVSWVQKVVGSNEGGMPTPEEVLGETFVLERLRLDFPDGEDGEPVITIGDEVLSAMNGLWKRCMIVKVLGRHVSVSVLSKRLREMWKPASAMYVMDLPRQFFMVRFAAEEEYLAALTGGPWRVFGSYLMVQAWTSGFDPLCDDITTTPVWVRLANLPLNLYHRTILMGIAKGLGNPIKVDNTTLNFERGRFARVCVEVNLRKPLKGSLVVNGERYFVSYEGLTNICSNCGLYGHLVHSCPKGVLASQKEAQEKAVVVAVQNPSSGGVSRGGTQADDGFTLVRPSGRKSVVRPEKVVFSAGGVSGESSGQNRRVPMMARNPANIPISNSFGSLEKNMGTTEIREEVVMIEANKENVDTGNQLRIAKSAGQDKRSPVGTDLSKKSSGMGDGHKVRRAANFKAQERNGPRPQQMKNYRPTQGLVFGPRNENVELSQSGKRLRVGSDGVGRDSASTDGVVVSVGEGSIQGAGVTRITPQDESSNPMASDVSSVEQQSSEGLAMKFKTEVLALFETHAGGDRASRICRGLGFENSYRVDAIGQSGGLWLLWRSEVGEVEIVEASDQFIHAKVINGVEVVNLIVVYAAPSVSRRSSLWDQLTTVIRGAVGPIVVGGDFNTIVRLDERSGGNGRLSPDSLAFGDWINELSLIDMGFKGNKFTWRRGRVASTVIAKRLDRVFCCAHSRLKWQEATVMHLPFLSSDHAPLYVQLSPEVQSDPKRRPFRFEAAWLKHSGFKDLLTASWKRDISTAAALVSLKDTLRRWNREVFGDVMKRKEKLLVEIKTVQDNLEVTPTDALLEREELLLKEFDSVLEQEELIWLQKSREKWFELGDRNTSFFHTSTVIRRRRNRIEMLKNDDGIWISEAKELEQLAIAYYRRLYSMDDIEAVVEQLPQGGFVQISDEDQNYLGKPFNASDVEKAVRAMGKFKSPGPDGYQPVFYQHCWEVVGESVVKFVLEFFATGQLPQDTNDALVVLIAKVAKPEKITQFRPISLCNVLFKMITKVMVERLKPVMCKLIGPAQSSFIPGRLSTDNIVIVQEAVHSMRRKKGRKGWMLLKLDLEKAYDRIRWDFLEDTLRAAGLSATWINWIMQCVAGPSMSLLWNGEKTEAFQPSRGLRQGDPISPYLFVLCMERLCHLIDLAVVGKKWKPISLSQGGPKLSHICFADDLILFAEASVAQIRVIRGVLERFCVASGQKVSLEKSKIFFSKNVSRELENLISDESGIKSTRELGKYLGMPVLQKRMNKETFGEILERMSSRLAGWKSRVLSFAGRLTLTKAVLSSIPVHSMSTIVLPASTLATLDKVAQSFLWGSTPEKRKQHLIGWRKVCLPKGEGGLGIRAAKDMNKALIAKVGWRLLNDKRSLWARVLRSKYRVGEPHDQNWMRVKSTWSSTWRSVGVGLREVVFPGLSWVIGDGSTLKFWVDKWVSNRPLLESVSGEMPANYESLTAKDLWRHGSGWMLEKIVPHVSQNVRLELATIVIDSVTGAKDRISWGESQNGEFTVQSAYALITRDQALRPNMSAFYRRVWRVTAPERVRVFLWLLGNQAIMTNEERHRRHLCDSNICQVCKGGVETIIHILRDCPAMAGIWTRIVPVRRRHEFFNKSLLEWMYDNLCDGVLVDDIPWATMFAMAIWWGWKWRCGNIFGENGKCRDRVRFVRELAKEVTMAHVSREELVGRRGRVERRIGWVPPTGDWMKLNTDGASKGNPGLAAAGGVLRDGDGNWCGGFAVNLGKCSAPLAELWGVYYGLYIAWERRVPHVILEVDSELVVGFLKTGIRESHPLSFLVRLCHGFISKDWTVRIDHVYREANCLADGLANHAFTLPLGFHFFVSAPTEVVSIVRDDVLGSTRPRMIPL
ncbi:Reverse transcriptase zinc-binding domain [Arabidopsis thaliana x Arabidopsis arenosa]|uniref:Reverse transcriptase zinc-binding domain n=1 Tax=Arabidopsis thaliana x Arabidopsis arenosa TaxID=1240361 RepID=A0A8T1ZJY5_9BRAS|nr:Reverse transcriptase zinc-binding domain [Arabidopsis thaliana x Arabidopsis arenosa]